MEITEKKISDLIIAKFKAQGFKTIEGMNPLAFLKSNDRGEYIKLYYNDHKITINADFDDDFYKIKGHYKEYLKLYPEADSKSPKTSILSRITKEAKEEMEHIWFTADYHHGHDNIVKFCRRPIKAEDQTEWLIEEVHNKYIEKQDRVYFLGDLSLAPRKEAEKFVDKLRGQKTLILGNHDKNLKNSTRFAQVTQRKEFSFNRFGLNISIVLDHYPLMSWNRSVHGAWHLYGHVHGRTKHPGLAMDIGIDNKDFEGYRPLNLYEVCEFMDKFSKSVKHFDHGEEQ